MKYKNVTKEVLKFRAHDSKGIVRVFELKPEKEIELDREFFHGGLELVEEEIEKERKGKSKKTNEGDE